MELPIIPDHVQILPPEPGGPDGPFGQDFGAPSGDILLDERRPDDRRTENRRVEGTQPLDAVHDVPVKVQAVLGRSRMPIGDLLRLRAGMVVELDRRVGEPVDIFVNDRLIARGEVVMIEQSLGVTLTEIVRPER